MQTGRRQKATSLPCISSPPPTAKSMGNAHHPPAEENFCPCWPYLFWRERQNKYSTHHHEFQMVKTSSHWLSLQRVLLRLLLETDRRVFVRNLRFTVNPSSTILFLFSFCMTFHFSNINSSTLEIFRNQIFYSWWGIILKYGLLTLYDIRDFS